MDLAFFLGFPWRISGAFRRGSSFGLGVVSVLSLFGALLVLCTAGSVRCVPHKCQMMPPHWHVCLGCRLYASCKQSNRWLCSPSSYATALIWFLWNVHSRCIPVTSSCMQYSHLHFLLLEFLHAPLLPHIRCHLTIPLSANFAFLMMMLIIAPKSSSSRLFLHL